MSSYDIGEILRPRAEAILSLLALDELSDRPWRVEGYDGHRLYCAVPSDEKVWYSRTDDTHLHMDFTSPPLTPVF